MPADSVYLSKDGSSPLTRGKHSLIVTLTVTCRLIPAHAGKTCRPPCRRPATTAHPRSRGENPRATRAPRTRTGSSPLTRGKLDQASQDLHAGRLIPAHAGKTAMARPLPRASSAHPRSRGENRPCPPSSRASDGSSPLTRGKLEEGELSALITRLIPAHAGKTYERKTGQPITRAHPRSRRENSEEVWRDEDVAGSSPLTRGKHACTQTLR